MTDLVAIGECRVEFAREKSGLFSLHFCGDTFNTAIYAARSGAKVAYATVLGDDCHSDGIVALAESEGIETYLIRRENGRWPGLCTVETDAKGQCSRNFWRAEAPARELFERDDWSQTAEALLKSRILHLSGVTLSLYSNEALGRLFATLELARKRGVVTSFHSNFHPQDWKGDQERARRVFLEALQRADIVFAADADEQALWGDDGSEASIERIKVLGALEICLLSGLDGALLLSEGVVVSVPAKRKVKTVDMTAANDGFAGAYLAARLKGKNAEDAVAEGHIMAAHVAQHKGAIAPPKKAKALQ